MNFRVIFLGSIFALLSSITLAYVVLVSMMGPWIAPTLVLLGALLLKIGKRSADNNDSLTQELAIIQSIGSVGGIVGTAIAFSLPMLYFLDAPRFELWLKNPFYFCTLIAALCFAAGGLGMYLARLFSEKLVVKEKLSFPVSTLIYNMITSQSQGAQSQQTVLGLSVSGIFCLIRDGFLSLPGLLPKTFYISPSIFGSECAIALFTGPTLWSIGFIAGSLIATPLIVGMISKYLILYPLNHHATFLPFSLFAPMSPESFSMAFCSGLVLIEALMGMVKYPEMIWNTIKEYFSLQQLQRLFAGRFSSGFVPTTPSTNHSPSATSILTSHWMQDKVLHLEGILSLALSLALLTYLGFSALAQIFMIFFTIIATYQMSYLSIKAGILPFGRFSLFVMAPMMLAFKLDYVQLTLLCVFVSICGGVASDLLFDYKVGELCGIKLNRIHLYQWVGLIVTALSMGVLLWLLFTSFQIGSPELFAKRGRTRALLIQATNFNMWVLMLGALFGWVLSKVKINPALALGGILMPNSISIGLIIGGLLSKITKNTEKYTPFWSGMFAGESLWILIYMLIKFAGY